MAHRNRVLGTLLLLAACTPSSAHPSVPREGAQPRGGRVPGPEAFAHLEEVEPYVPFQERREGFVTDLAHRGPSQAAALPKTPEGAEVVTYRSGELVLKGWLAKPAGAESSRPGVVFLHNDFSLKRLAYDHARPFLDAGFVLFLPALRGENGNPGTFELLLGEVRDAASAVRFLSEQPGVDGDHGYVMGHSIGGGIAALLSLEPDLPVRMLASVGGIYRARTFHSWASRPSTRHLVRFDPNDRAEVTLRLLGPNIRDMAHPLIAYAGRGDRFDTAYARHLAERADFHGAPYRYVPVEGDHMASIGPAVTHFIERIRDHWGEAGNAELEPL